MARNVGSHSVRVVGVSLATALLTLAMASASGALAAAQRSSAGSSSAGVGAVGDRQVGKRKNSGPAPLIDHGGPVLTSSKTVAIYWGSGFGSDLEVAMTQLLSGFSRSNYLALANEYLHGGSATNAYVGAIHDPSAPPSHAPTTTTLGAEVGRLVASPDPNTLYIVYTSNFPKINYCAYHGDATANGVTFEVAYVPAQPAGCSPYTVSNLGANSYSDATVSAADSTAHEFMETVTDPHLNAWYDKSGEEVADKCNYVYQSVVTLANHSRWQIQEEWSNAAMGCVQGS